MARPQRVGFLGDNRSPRRGEGTVVGGRRCPRWSTERHWAVAGLTLTLLLGCPEAPSGVSVPGPCQSFGQKCQFAPGKLGTCVSRPDCAEPAGAAACFTCQSQH